VNIDVIGDKANATRPEIEQIMIANPRGVPDATFENDLYVIRRRIEKRTAEARINDFYICSLSCRSVIYKGMFLAEQVTAFYPDLLDARFTSSFAIYHQRYSTNTFPTWRLAQPFRVLAHNGEINTLRGNVNWMACHEPRMAHEALGEAIEDVKPVIQPGGSDSAALDAVFELLVRAGRPLPMAKTLCVPPAWTPDESLMPQAHRDLYSYCNSVMEPWDGPAALCATDGRWVMAGMDRNGLRPLRYAILDDGLMIAGSETGMVKLDEARVLEKGRLGPGMMIAVDLERGRVLKDAEIKDELAARKPFGGWVRHITRIDRHHPRPRDQLRGLAARRSPAARDRGRLEHGGHRADPRPHGRGRQGGGRLDGRRHAGRRAVRGLSRSAPFLPPEFFPGHQPANRQPARTPGHDHPHPPGQSRQHPRRGREPVPAAAAREPGVVDRRVHGDARLHGRDRVRDRLHLPGGWRSSRRPVA